jgi:hypothetical protein
MTDNATEYVATRIRAEYLEMPGLKLTLPQAARLFNVEASDCARVLDTLVTTGVLWTDGRSFAHASSGRRWV